MKKTKQYPKNEQRKKIYKDKKLILRKKMFNFLKIRSVIDVNIKHHIPMDGIHP
jgi:hypothetical protein